MKVKAYVFDNTEVVLTGRSAERTVGRRDKTKTDVLVEITPRDDENGSWKKFVRDTELYEIVED